MYDFDNIDVSVNQFVDEYIDSFITWDLILFFYENPFTVGSPSSIAMNIGRLDSDVQPYLEKLVEKGIVTRETPTRDGAEIIYSYKPNDEFEKKVEQFKKSLRDRTSRLMIVSKVLQKEAKK
jgi:predicted transcriptional regulator